VQNTKDLLSGKPTPKAVSKEPNPYPAWEYETVEFSGYHKDEETGEWRREGLVWSDESNPGFIGSKEMPMEMSDLGGFLSEVGRDGWELSWHDGKQFIFKRPCPADISQASWWRHDGFYIVQM
jgi:hypothetical protein